MAVDSKEYWRKREEDNLKKNLKTEDEYVKTIHGYYDYMMDQVLNNRTLGEFERQAGILGKTIKNNAQTAHAIVNASFANAKFSDRIWMYQDMLKVELSKLLQEGLIQGRNPRQLARHLEKLFGVSKANAERLMRTELARVQIEAQKQLFERNGFKQYEFIALGSACGICKELDGKHFKVKDMIPEENAAPMHPNCRCSVAAWVDDEEYEEWLDYLDKGGTENRSKISTTEKAALFVGTVMNGVNPQKAKDNIEKPSESSKIELADINKMITPYERKVLDAIPKKEGCFDFAAHGSADNIEYGSRDFVLNARDVARIIKHSELYNGEKVRLLSCNTGSTDTGFAQQLANALGVEVEAPSDILIVYPNDKYKIGYDGKGKMITFKPQKRK